MTTQTYEDWQRKLADRLGPKLGRCEAPSTGQPAQPRPSSSASLPDTLSSWGPLHSGATWNGVQKSGRNSYQVKVTLETVNVDKGTMTGLLEIHGLTPDLDKLVTYFDGEIVTSHGEGFITNRWGATEKEDLQHWARFPSFHSVKSQAAGPKLNYNHLDKPFLFMRWKEQFVLPDSKTKNIHGASFAGFYYLCLSLEEEPRIPLPTRRASSSSRPLAPPSSLSPPRLPLPSRSPPPTASSPSMLARTLPSPPLMRLRSVSYAAALRGSTPSPPVITLAPEPISTEVRAPVQQTNDPSPSIISDGIQKDTETDTQTVSAPIPINLPNGMTLEDFPVPTSPPLSSPTMLWGSGSRRGRRASSSLTSPRSNEAAPQTIASLRKDEPTYGMRSWTRARLSGFYYFRNSEPYQELELSYSPRNKGGSPTFDIC